MKLKRNDGRGTRSRHQHVFSLSLTFVFWLVISAFITSCYNYSDEFRGDLEGYVTIRNTDIPLANVEVQIESLRDSSYFVTTTDEDGYYFYEDVHFGVNKVVFKKGKYNTIIKYPDIRKDDVFNLDVEMRIDAPDYFIYSGVKVVDETNRMPVEGAIVDVYIREGFTGFEFWDYYTTHFTDEDGGATFFLGLLNRKQSFFVELRIAAHGYEELRDTYYVFYQKRQKLHHITLTPAGS